MGNKELDAKRNGEQESEEVIVLTFENYCPQEFMPYIYGKFKRSLRHGNDYFSLMDQENFSKAYDVFIPHLISKSILRLAALKSDRDILLGFSLIEDAKLHYVFVQAEFRKLGIGKMLIPHAIDTITHVTKMGLQLWSSKLPKAKFKPF